ncbi:TerC family protein [Marininema halotolerans]|uniref:Integral membrane protein, YjbE family n=1 Tax=Marininema halotolerans TaxID=1155944 RepID=A0A1I6STL9_9BACL|nr:TerC family protein [Marininema halotolerans]SFS80243.1 integral membrane protein, YjbE family [Marininema halotolerans]
MDAQFWLGFINIIILDLVLSGDNAVVIGMASRKLPAHQQKQAILYGTIVAVILRVLLTLIAVWLLKIPLLKAVGGLLLVWIAIKLLMDEDEEEDLELGYGLKSAVKTIIIADVVMSLDNVLAVAGAAHGDFLLVLLGLALSVPILMGGSRIVATVMNKLPWLVYVGSGILAYTAGQLLVEDKIIHDHLVTRADYLTWMTPTLLIGLVLGAGYLFRGRRT